jgi:hypothetical protein
MKLDERLNLVVPVELNGAKAYVHSVPISIEVYEQFFDVMVKAFNEVTSLGLDKPASIRTARLWLRKSAQAMGRWDEVQSGLINEIRRLTNVLMVSANGWETVPLQQCIQSKMLDAEDVSEVENAVIFFTFLSHLTERPLRKLAQIGGSGVLGGLATSLNCTEYSASLGTSTAPASSGAAQIPTAPLSSVVY